MSNKSTNFDLSEHRHRFATWAAARAAQRGHGGATVVRLSQALDSINIRAFALNPPTDGRADTFDRYHEKWCAKISSQIGNDFSYGRSAKLVAIYLKAMIVCGPEGTSPIASHVHPPIDRVLLTALRKEGIIHSSPAWTRLDKTGYLEIVEQLRERFPVLWHAERYWSLDAK